MLQQKKYLNGILAFCMGLSVATPLMADGMPENTETELSVESESVASQVEDVLKIDEKSETVLAEGEKRVSSQQKPEEAIATITAEGDFVVPMFVLPAVVRSDSMDKGVHRLDVEEKQTETIRELPVIKITQTELVPVQEQMAVERRLTGKTTKTTKMYREALARSQGETVAESESQVVNPAEQNGRTVAGVADEVINDVLSETSGKNVGVKETVKKKRLLLPLKPVVSKDVIEETASYSAPVYKTYASEVADKMLIQAQEGGEVPALMPQDIKVTFYPNSTEFSGQMVKWIKVFSLQARQDPRYIINIRLSKTNPTIQQKRLFVIQRILMNTGLSLHQIVVEYVDRPENSLVLRMVHREDNVETRKVQQKNGQIKENKLIKW